jgi:hypothetical protein
MTHHPIQQDQRQTGRAEGRKRWLFVFILTACLGFNPEVMAMQLQAPKNGVIEFALQSTQNYADPYNDADLDVEFKGPDGKSFQIPAFWDGGNVWKIRFNGSQFGEYTYRTTCSKPEDAGLHGQTGSIRVWNPSAPPSNPLLAHGRVRAAANKRYFEHIDGTPFLWIGDTWWMGLCKRLDWPGGFQKLAADRVAKGFSVIQIIAGPLPDMDAWDPRGQNEAGYPFTQGFKSINPAYYDLADLKIQHLVSSGLMPCIVGMWGYYLPQIGEPGVKRYWRYIVARYGAYPVAWCIAGEGTMAYYLSKTPKEDAQRQKKGWTEVMAIVRKIDGYHNPISIHPTQFARDMVEDPSLLDFEMLQTGHGDMESLPNVRESVAKSYSAELRMPVVNSEVNYEGIMGRSYQNIQRWCFWLTLLNGAAGHTYGANGIWQMSTPEQPYGPSPHGRSWGNTPWVEAYQLPGSKQIGIGAKFLMMLPWWELEPHPEWIDPSGPDDPWRSAAAGIPGVLRILYATNVWDPPLVKGIEKGVAYEASYFDPCTGKDFPIGKVEADGDGDWRPALPPEVHDWVLVLEAKK